MQKGHNVASLDQSGSSVAVRRMSRRLPTRLDPRELARIDASGPSPLAVQGTPTQSCIGPICSIGLSDTITTTRKIDPNGLLACFI